MSLHVDVMLGEEEDGVGPLALWRLGFISLPTGRGKVALVSVLSGSTSIVVSGAQDASLLDRSSETPTPT